MIPNYKYKNVLIKNFIILIKKRDQSFKSSYCIWSGRDSNNSSCKEAYFELSAKSIEYYSNQEGVE